MSVGGRLIKEPLYTSLSQCSITTITYVRWRIKPVVGYVDRMRFVDFGDFVEYTYKLISKVMGLQGVARRSR